MIRRRNIDPGSLVRGPVGPFRTMLPATDFGGIADYTPTAIGEKVPLSGSYCKNISTDTFSADIKIPCPICITSAGNGDLWAIQVEGVDHLGNWRTEQIWKGNNLRQVECNGMICWSYIKAITIIGASTIATRLRLGFSYCNWGISGGIDLGAPVTTGNGAARRIPLPYVPIGTSDVRIECVGSSMQTLISDAPPLTILAYTAGAPSTVVASSVAWSFVTQGARVNDYMLTADGYIGRITALDEGTQTISFANGWFRNGTSGVPSTPSTVLATKSPQARIIREAFASPYAAGTGGMWPTQPVAALAPVSFTSAAISGATYTYTTAPGVNLPTSTFGGFLITSFVEPCVPVEFNVYVTNGAAY